MMQHPLDYHCILFDLDGTLRGCTAHGGAPCHNGPGEWHILAGVKETLACYDWEVVHMGVVTNQAGIALGYVTGLVVEQEILSTLVACWDGQLLWSKTTRVGGPIYRYAPEHPGARSYRRKPSPYMLLDLVGAYGARLDQTLYVGDSAEDEEAAQRAGVAFMEAYKFFGRAPQPLNTIKAYQVQATEKGTR